MSIARIKEVGTKEVVLRYRGSKESIQFAVNALAKRGGHKELTEAELKAGQVQLTKEQVALNYVTDFIREIVKQETIKDLKIELSRQALEAEAQALKQANAGLDVITKSLEVKDINE